MLTPRVRKQYSLGGNADGLPAKPAVDEQWYINQYSDVAHAVVMGSVEDAAAHYTEFGYAEGRLPAAPTST